MVKGLERTKSVLAAALVALVAATPVLAQDDIKMDGGETGPQPVSAGAGAEWFPSTGRLGPFSASAGVNIVTSYFFRGYEQEDSGGIFQPWMQLDLQIYSNDNGPLNGLAVYAGWWNSVHTEGNTAGGNSNWYETDIYCGANLTFLDHWTLGAMFIDYEYPGLGSTAIRELDFSLSFDDSFVWEKLPLPNFAINPYALYAIEIQNSPGEISNSYFETGIKPGFDIPISDNFAIGVSFPLFVGLSIDNYYGDDVFGYFNFGANFSVPLAFIPKELGDWTFDAGVTGLYLNDQVGLTDTGSSWECYGTFGISMSY